MTVRELCESIADEGRHIFIELSGTMRTKRCDKKEPASGVFKREDEILAASKLGGEVVKFTLPKSGSCIEAGVSVRMAGNFV